MKTSQNTYSDIVEKIKGKTPVLENQDEMLKNIMLEVEQLKPTAKQNKVITMLSRISGIAAAFLLSFLAYETFLVQEYQPQNNQVQIAESSFESTQYELADQFKNGNLTVKKEIILSVMAQEEQKDKERKTFYASIFNYAQNK